MFCMAFYTWTSTQKSLKELIEEDQRILTDVAVGEVSRVHTIMKGSMNGDQHPRRAYH
jgi:hypothetical protein